MKTILYTFLNGRTEHRQVSDRDYEIMLKVKSGRRFNDIGKEYNLSRERIRQIFLSCVGTNRELHEKLKEEMARKRKSR